MIADLDICNKYLDELINHPVSEDEVRGGRCFYKWNENLPYDRSYEINTFKNCAVMDIVTAESHDIGEDIGENNEFRKISITCRSYCWW